MSGTALKWDTSKQYETGVSDGALFVGTAGANGNVTYSNPEAWDGLIKVSENPSGAEPTKLYANNGKYLEILGEEEFGGNIEAYASPESFDACDGSLMLATGVKIGQQSRKIFAFVYKTKIGTQSDPDAGYKLHIVYGCKAKPSGKDYQTVNDSPEAMTLSWEFSATPVTFKFNDKQYKTATVTIDSRKVNEADLKTFEESIYNTEATLPMPDDILNQFDDGVVTNS